MKSAINPAPSASDGPVVHADWLELRALEAVDQNSSIQDLIQVIRRSGSTDALEDLDVTGSSIDHGSEKSQSIAEDAFGEVEDRFSSCGGRNGTYPFEIGPQNIQLRDTSPYFYLFLLLLSRFGKDAGPKKMDGAKIFEEVSIQAAKSYFGGSALGAETYHFGAPRRSPKPADFVSALNEMCRNLEEGVACRMERPNVGLQKDAKLDLAVWHPFCDGRYGKLIGFGQCATGKDWPDKLGELQPVAFCEMWMNDIPTVHPVRLFFVPFRVDKRRWMYYSRLGGIVFDRCRIAFHTGTVTAAVEGKCRKWVSFVSSKYLRK